MPKHSFLLSYTIILLLIVTHASSQSLSFSKPLDISSGNVAGVTSLDAADFNLDGLWDILVAEGGKHAQKPSFAWYEQQPDNMWKHHPLGHLDMLDSFLGSAKCADVDGDQDMDFVITSDNHAYGPIKVFFFENPGKDALDKDWNFHLLATIDGFHANDMQIADMDGDDKLDVIIRHKGPNTIRILLQEQDFPWSVISLSTEKLGEEGFAVGDLNNDEQLDIAVNGYWFKAPANPRKNSYTIFPIDTTYVSINPNTKEDIGDINQDGLNDIIISPAEAYYGGKDHVLAWYQAPKDPEKGKWIQHIIQYNYNHAHAVKLADMDQDGDLDVVSGQAWPPRRITIYLNHQSDFNENYIVIEGKGIYSGAVVDMDQDGDLDIVGEDTYANAARPWYYENLIQQQK